MKTKKILIVDDDHYFREALQQCLEAMGYKVLASETVKQAIRGFEIFSPDLVLSDVNLPGESGILLLRELKSTHPDVPVVMMTGFADLLDAVQAAEMGAAALISKPFKEADLEKIFKSIFAPQRQKQTEEKAEFPGIDFCRISIDEFVTGKDLRYSIFVKIGPDENSAKYVKVAHTGEDLSTDRIQSYKQKGLKHLYIRTEDFRSYVGLLDKVSSKLASSGVKIPPEKKMWLINHTLEQVNQEMVNLPLSQDSFDHVDSIMNTTVRVLAEDNNTFQLLDSLRTGSDKLYAHSALVSVISTIIAKNHGWSSTPGLVKVATAGLLHDIGKKQLSKELIDKRRSEMNAEELSQYEKHPMRGFEILSDSSPYPPEITQAILHHHERGDGTGFPGHLFALKIIPLAHILAVADEFAHSADRFRKNGKTDFKAAMDHMLSTKAQTLQKNFVDALVTGLFGTGLDSQKVK